jgi:dehydrogenase/reductase SDR family protein 4
MYGCGQALAAELAPKTRVNGIAPGFVPTRFSAFLAESAEIVLSRLLYPLYGN